MTDRYYVMNDKRKLMPVTDVEGCLKSGVNVYDEYGNEICDMTGLKRIGFVLNTMDLSGCAFRVVDHELNMLSEWEGLDGAVGEVNRLLKKNKGKLRDGMYRIEGWKGREYEGTIYVYNMYRLNV